MQAGTMPRAEKTQAIEMIVQSISLTIRSLSGRQKVDIFCPVRVSGWINNIQHIVVAVANVDYSGYRNLSFYTDSSYSIQM
jgi:hypothetical protein